MLARSAIGLVAILLATSGLALGQVVSPPATESPPAASPESTARPGPADSGPVSDKGAMRAAAKTKRRACRREGKSKGMSGPDLKNYATSCVKDARMACRKQAAEQKDGGGTRRELIIKCMGSPRSAS